MLLRLTKWANRHWVVMMLLGLLPTVLVVLYIFFYMSALSRMVAVLRYNDTVARTSVILPVKEVVGDEVILGGVDDFIVPAADDELIYTLIFWGINNFEYCSADGYSCFTTGNLLVDAVEYVEDGFNVSIAGEWVKLQSGDIAFEVWREGDNFRVLVGDAEYQLAADSIGSYISDIECQVFTGQRELAPEDRMLYYVQDLAGDTLWMDILQGSYVSAVSSNFRWRFILDSGLYFIGLELLVLTLLLYKCLKVIHVEASHFIAVFKINLCALLVLVLLVVFTFVML